MALSLGTKAEQEGEGAFPESERRGALGLFMALPLRRAGCPLLPTVLGGWKGSCLFL